MFVSSTNNKVAGYAVGGGHVLHMVCDLTIAADNAIFGQTGPKVIVFYCHFLCTMNASCSCNNYLLMVNSSKSENLGYLYCVFKKTLHICVFHYFFYLVVLKSIIEVVKFIFKHQSLCTYR